VQALTKPGRHADGGGLYLLIDKGGSKRWVFLYRDRATQKLREMGLGGVRSVSLAQARLKAAAARSVVVDGQDPIKNRRTLRQGSAKPTFGALADELIASMASAWRNPKHRAQWEMTTTVYCKPLRNMPVDAITTADVIKVLQPIWHRIPETASRVRGRIERVLNAAKAKGLRSGENPAQWRGHLDHLLPARRKLTRGHHAAMPFKDVPAFITSLRRLSSVAPAALEFAILTAAPSGEVLGARWSEIDFELKVWTIPAARMKAAKEHRVPLSIRAIALIERMKPLATRADDHVFPGQKAGTPLSSMSLASVMRRLDRAQFTPHGFRSSFRDWCGECTAFPREVAEAALAHTLNDKTEAAYRRGDALEKRRDLMAAWAKHLDSDP
jgi:integrase